MNYFSKNFSTGRQAVVKRSSSHVNRQSSIVNACKGRFIYVVVGQVVGQVVGLRS